MPDARNRAMDMAKTSLGLTVCKFFEGTDATWERFQGSIVERHPEYIHVLYRDGDDEEVDLDEEAARSALWLDNLMVCKLAWQSLSLLRCTDAWAPNDDVARRMLEGVSDAQQVPAIERQIQVPPEVTSDMFFDQTSGMFYDANQSSGWSQDDEPLKTRQYTRDDVTQEPSRHWMFYIENEVKISFTEIDSDFEEVRVTMLQLEQPSEMVYDWQFEDPEDDSPESSVVVTMLLFIESNQDGGGLHGGHFFGIQLHDGTTARDPVLCTSPGHAMCFPGVTLRRYALGLSSPKRIILLSYIFHQEEMAKEEEDDDDDDEDIHRREGKKQRDLDTLRGATSTPPQHVPSSPPPPPLTPASQQSQQSGYGVQWITMAHGSEQAPVSEPTPPQATESADGSAEEEYRDEM